MMGEKDVEVLVECSVVNPPRLVEGIYYKEIAYMIVRRKSDGEVFVIVQATTNQGYTNQITFHWPIIEMMVADKEEAECDD